MNPFVAWAVSWQGTAALMACALVCGMILGWLAGDARGYRKAGRDAAEDRADAKWARQLRQMRTARPIFIEPREVAAINHARQAEAWRLHEDQALALVRDDLTDSAYTADMAARMDRFLEGLCGVPYSADELWSGQ